MAKKKAAKAEPIKGTWIVEMRCTIARTLICEGCSEEEARTNPQDHAIGQQDGETIDWEVTSVRASD